MRPGNFFGSERPLNVELDVLADGDSEFKQELVLLMIENLMELQEVVKEATKRNDQPLFNKVCHKIKTTIHMLEDKEFSDVIDQLKSDINDVPNCNYLIKLCSQIIDSLRRAQ